ncbi:hypothetical protein BaRGS_00021508 [Batillaria attramentaria]|uniref:ShKT domain-containing protein n=1 Tax=Batillaria attramentaria TaxID=370345 RepID=A0ABD0KJP6_9CAEN
MLLHLCTRPEDYYQHDCHFCCPDEQCFKTVYNLLTSPRPSPSVQPPATSSHLSTAAFQQSTSYTLSSQPLTTSQQPSTSAQAPPDNCTDKYDEHFCIDAAADCDNPIVHDVCPKTCGFCGTCFSCSGLDCLLNPTKLDCKDGYCMTTVMDTTHGRDIKRECATKRQCDGILLQPTCRQIENKILGAGVTCAYCCNHPDCNEPPSLIPDAASLITHH